MEPQFAPLDDGPGLEVVDPIENCRFALRTARPVSPTPAATDGFAFPVAAACELAVEELSVSSPLVFAVRDAADASQVAELRDGARAFDPGAYLLELNGPVKLYVRVEAAFEAAASERGVRVSFDGPVRVRVGARSYHTSPAATVTVPDDPAGAMAAISTFGSALKTTTCERSWPTLRGHPPRVERGAALSIPDGLEPPDTGVTIRVPADYEHVYPVAPLAYYLGATVEPGDEPRLVTDAGFERSLDTERGFEAEVVRMLKQVFRLDCVTRTEGYYRIPLAERRRLERRPEVDLDFAALYDRPLAEQLAAYLSVPYAALDGLRTWNRATYARPAPDTVELLPFVVDDLSVVRTRSPTGSASSPEPGEREAVASFKRQPDRTEAYGVPRPSGYVPLPDDDADAVERAWVGDGTPVHGTKLLKAAFERDRTASPDGVVDVTVVCNDERMRGEWDAAADAYGSGGAAAFDVERRFGATTDELRDLLAEDTDLFHYVGHTDGRGFACPDGVFDAASLESAGATTVLLNSCRSHDQGRALVAAGARAAVVSLADVDNLAALEVGETVARLLDYGFGVGSALEVVEEYTAVGRQYVALGDPSVTVAPCEDMTPVVSEIAGGETATAPDDELTVTPRGYEADGRAMGAVLRPEVQAASEKRYYLSPGALDAFEVTVERFERALDDYAVPVVVGGELTWSDEWLADR